jgi:uncharacterized membrane protein YGL010W
MANELFRSQLASYATVHRDWRNKATRLALDLGIGVVMGLIMAVAWYAAEAFVGALGSTHAAWIAFIGPMFLVAEAMVVMGQRRDLAEVMGEGDVTAR